MNNTVNSLFSEMQQHQRFQIRQEPMPTHMHEELLLQGMLVGTRYGTGVMMQGPHDILYAETKIVTPAGTHKVIMMDEQKKYVGSFQRWHSEFNPPTSEQLMLIHQWDLANNGTRGARCNRQHRTDKEARSCTGVPKPVQNLTDFHDNMRFNPAPRPWQGQRSRSTSSARRGPSNIRRTYPSPPVPSGNIFHFNASTTSPGSTVELHPPPRYPDIKPIRKNMMCRQPIRPNNRNIQHGMETAPMVGVKQELDNCQKQIQRTKENLEEINEQSGKLLSLFLCNECNGESEREVGLQPKSRAMENTEAPPQFSGEQPQVPQANLMQNLQADQNPAVIVIQPPPSPPPQGRNTPASLPSLGSLQAEEESDLDIEIIGYAGPRRNRVNFPREDNDTVAQLAAGAQNLLL